MKNKLLEEFLRLKGVNDKDDKIDILERMAFVSITDGHYDLAIDCIDLLKELKKE